MFFIQEKCSFHSTFDLSVMQSIATNNEQMMTTKLHTFALKHILCKTVKN